MTELEAFRKGKVTFIVVVSGMRVISFLGEIYILWLEVVVILKVDGDDAYPCEADSRLEPPLQVDVEALKVAQPLIMSHVVL